MATLANHRQLSVVRFCLRLISWLGCSLFSAQQSSTPPASLPGAEGAPNETSDHPPLPEDPTAPLALAARMNGLDAPGMPRLASQADLAGVYCELSERD